MGGVSLPPAKPHETMSVLARPRPLVEISLLRNVREGDVMIDQKNQGFSLLR